MPGFLQKKSKRKKDDLIKIFYNNCNNLKNLLLEKNILVDYGSKSLYIISFIPESDER